MRVSTLFLPLSAAVFFMAPAAFGAPDKTEDALAYFRDLAETRNYTLGLPVSPKFTPDGKQVVFLRADARDPSQRLFELDVDSGSERELLTPAQLLSGTAETLSPEEKARRERARVQAKGFTQFDLSRDGAHVLLTLSGQLYVVNRATLDVTALPGDHWIDPRFSPDGQFVSACAQGELFIIDIASRESRQLTSGADAAVSNGTAEFVAQEEMERREGYWWSPDSNTLAFQQTDESRVPVRHVADPLHPGAEPTRFRYPHAGSENARVRLGLLPRTGGETRWVRWDATTHPYLARVLWKAGGPLTLLVQNRAQTEQVLLEVDPNTLETRPLITERDAAWLNLDGESVVPRWVDGGQRFLWTTERTGSWQVELRARTGELIRELTPREFHLESLVGVSEARAEIYVRGSWDSRAVGLWRFPLSGGAGSALTSAPGIYRAVFAEKGDRSALLYELADGQTGADVRDGGGTVLAGLRSVAEPLPRRPNLELTHVTAGSLRFDAAVIRPHAFEPGQKYPVILHVYAGPTVKRVLVTPRGYLPDQWMADQGFIVVRIDGRGTPGRNRDWERVVKGNLIDIPLEDQVAGLRALGAKYPELDLQRVGVTGWSFGGYVAAMAACRRPDVFKCAVAGAPVVTWENYDTHYTERYLGLPQEQPDAYRVSNVTTYASELQRPLLLIHGLTDDNVYAQHTLQMADALFQAGKHYEFLPLLGTHMVTEPETRLRLQTRIIEFFDQHLKTR